MNMGPNKEVFLSLSFVYFSDFLTFFLFYKGLLPYSLFLWIFMFIFLFFLCFISLWGLLPLFTGLFSIFVMTFHEYFYVFSVLFFCLMFAFDPGPHIKNNVV